MVIDNIEQEEREYVIKKAFATYGNCDFVSDDFYVYSSDFENFSKMIKPYLSYWEKDTGFHATVFEDYVAMKWKDFIKESFNLGEFILFMSWAETNRKEEDENGKLTEIMEPSKFDPKEFIKQLNRLNDVGSIYNLLNTYNVYYAHYNVENIFKAILPPDKKASKKHNLHFCKGYKEYPYDAIYNAKDEKGKISLIIKWYLDVRKK